MTAKQNDPVLTGALRFELSMSSYLESVYKFSLFVIPRGSGYPERIEKTGFPFSRE
jgi:hypothetical protein